MRYLVVIRFVAPLTVTMLPMVASACLVCDSAVGREVQGGVFNGSFAQTALAVLLPFPVLLLALAAIDFAIPRLLNRNGKD